MLGGLVRRTNTQRERIASDQRADRIIESSDFRARREGRRLGRGRAPVAAHKARPRSYPGKRGLDPDRDR